MDFDWQVYTGNLKWLPERTIYLTRHGSHAYGTNTPTSDIDIRGVAVPPLFYYLGISAEFKTAEQKEPIDLTVFDFLKFIKLSSDANPNALELLFTDESDHLFVHPVMETVLANREMFLSQKAKHTFSGYARSQLKRMNAHYRWLKNPPLAPPTRHEFGLPERTVIPADQLAAANAAIQKQVDQWGWKEMDDLDPAQRQAVQDEFTKKLVEITQWSWQDVEGNTWLAAAGAIGLNENFIRLLDLERQYTGRLREWQNYQKWQKERNEARAELEAKFGYDTKHAMHLVRLTRMCRELLETGKVTVRRPDAQELLAIRHGAWTYEQLIEYSDREDEAFNELIQTCKLPRQPDRQRIDNLCIEVIQKLA